MLRQADLFESQLEAASELQAEGDLAGAVRLVTPAARVPSYARPVAASIALRKAVSARMLERIEQAAEMPGTGGDRLMAVELLVAAGEEFAATLPDVARGAGPPGGVRS